LAAALRGHWTTFVLRTSVFALGAALRGHWTTSVLRTPVFALGAALRAHWTTFVLRAPVFALGAARRAHGRSRPAGGQFSSFMPRDSPREASTSLISFNDLRPRFGVFRSSVSVRWMRSPI